MEMLRKLALGVSSAVLKFCLFWFVITHALVNVFGTPDALKNSLEESGVYSNVIDGVAEGLKNQQNKNREEDVMPLDRPEIIQIAKSAFTPEVLRSGAESVIDGFYGWFEGRTSRPEFSVDLSQPKSQFVQGVGEYAANRLESLPECTRQQNLELAREKTIDPLTVNCRPPIDIESEKQRLIAELGEQKGFLSDPVITAEHLKRENGEPVDFEGSRVPEGFQGFRILPVVLALMAALTGVGTILLSRKRQAGLWRVGVSLFGTGLFLVISMFVFEFLLNNFDPPVGFLGKETGIGGGLQSSVQETIRLLFAEISRQVWWLGGAFAAIGGLSLIILHATRDKVYDNSGLANEVADGSSSKTNPSIDDQKNKSGF